MSQVEWIAAAPAANFPSAPLWHPGEKRLYWADIASCRLFRLDPSTGEAETLLDDGHPVGAIVLRADGSLLLFRDCGNVVVLRDGAMSEEVVPPLADCRQTRYSCAAADSAGRVVCAMLSDARHPARLFLLDQKGHLTLVKELFGIPSGLAFVDEGRAMLLSNSYATRPETMRIEYDASAAALPFVGVPSAFYRCQDETPRPRGAPAGMALAADGSVLVARVGGGAISRHIPEGDRLAMHSFPVKRPVGLCFGGEGLRDLYVTTAGAHRPVLDGANSGELAVFRDFPVAGAAPYCAGIGD